MPKQQRLRLAKPFLFASMALAIACGESRQERLQRELSYDNAGKAKKVKKVEAEVPPHPTREALRPLLEKIYSQNKLPDVLDASIEVDDEFKYELTPGVLAAIRIPQGGSTPDQVRAIVMGTAEADAWAYRPDARRPYSELIHRVKRGYGDDQKELILKRYADLKLMNFFNSPEAEQVIAGLPADVKPTVEAMRKSYIEDKEMLLENGDTTTIEIWGYIATNPNTDETITIDPDDYHLLMGDGNFMRMKVDDTILTALNREQMIAHIDGGGQVVSLGSKLEELKVPPWMWGTTCKVDELPLPEGQTTLDDYVLDGVVVKNAEEE